MINFGFNAAHVAYRGCSKFIRIPSARAGNNAARVRNVIIRMTDRKLILKANLQLLASAFHVISSYYFLLRYHGKLPAQFNGKNIYLRNK